MLVRLTEFERLAREHADAKRLGRSAPSGIGCRSGKTRAGAGRSSITQAVEERGRWMKLAGAHAAVFHTTDTRVIPYGLTTTCSSPTRHTPPSAVGGGTAMSK